MERKYKDNLPARVISTILDKKGKHDRKHELPYGRRHTNEHVLLMKKPTEGSRYARLIFISSTTTLSFYHANLLLHAIASYSCPCSRRVVSHTLKLYHNASQLIHLRRHIHVSYVAVSVIDSRKAM
jgi:hypothetical protein